MKPSQLWSGPVALALMVWVAGAAQLAAADRSGGKSMSQVAASADSGKRESAVLAGGCFWGMEELIRELDGVVETEVGYAGGESVTASYDRVKRGSTGHAESIRVVFDPERLPYAELLEFFFRIHDPTTLNRQGNDIGTQYRSAIFVNSEQQKATAEAVKAKVDGSGKWRRPVVTAIVEGAGFWPAEGYHQDYLQKNPGGYTCHYVRDFDFASE